jgi:hypothetical protein
MERKPHRKTLCRNYDETPENRSPDLVGVPFEFAGKTKDPSGMRVISNRSQGCCHPGHIGRRR